MFNPGVQGKWPRRARRIVGKILTAECLLRPGARGHGGSLGWDGTERCLGAFGMGLGIRQAPALLGSPYVLGGPNRQGPWISGRMGTLVTGRSPLEEVRLEETPRDSPPSAHPLLPSTYLLPTHPDLPVSHPPNKLPFTLICLTIRYPCVMHPPSQAPSTTCPTTLRRAGNRASRPGHRALARPRVPAPLPLSPFSPPDRDRIQDLPLTALLRPGSSTSNLLVNAADIPGAKIWLISPQEARLLS